MWLSADSEASPVVEEAVTVAGASYMDSACGAGFTSAMADFVCVAVIVFLSCHGHGDQMLIIYDFTFNRLLQWQYLTRVQCWSVIVLNRLLLR